MVDNFGRLYLNDKGRQRLLDDDEPLGNLVSQNKIKSLFHIQSATFIFKKYMFLSSSEEEQDYKQDHVRLNLIAYQVLDEIRSEKYYLSFHDYCLYAALYAYFQCDDQVAMLSLYQLKLLKPESVIPPLIYKSNKDKVWWEHIFQMMKSLSSEIKTVYVRPCIH